MSKTLAAVQIRLNLVDLIQSTVDPTAGAGIAGAIGSLYLRSGTAGMWQKTGAGNTAWSQLVQSFAWFSVKDFGARGDNLTDDTAAIQAAINACATAGGGVVWFPGASTYRVTQLTINAQNNVQLCGADWSSTLRWTFNAAGAAGSMITITGSSSTVIRNLKLDGAGLTNPAASRLNHLITIGNATAANVVDTKVQNCWFTGMVAASGDGVHVLGTAANLVDRFWIDENTFDGCSRFGVCVEQGTRFGWVSTNFFTNCETDIAMLPSGAVANENLQILDNEILHTGAVRHALRVEGNGGTVSTSITIANNTIIGGFATISGVTYCVFDMNILTSGAFASADAAVRVFGAVTYMPFTGNLIARDVAATVGPCAGFERSGGASPSFVRVGRCVLVNDRASGNFITVVDTTRLNIGGNICRSADGGSNNYGFDFQAVTIALTDIQIGPANTFTAAAGSMAACVRLLVNGANVVDVSIIGNQGDNCDFALRTEDAGAGSFTGKILYAGNNIDGATGDINQVGTTVRPNIGFNAGGAAAVVGPQCISGTGSPEGVISARVGSQYLRTDGGQATVVYYKETGSSNTGWVAIGGWPVVFGTTDTGVAATALFLGPGYIAAASATETQIPIPRPGILRNLRVNVKTAGTTAETNTYTTRVNGANTAIVATISNTATGLVSDLVNTVAVVAGDLVSLQVTKTGVVVAGQSFVVASLEIV